MFILDPSSLRLAVKAIPLTVGQTTKNDSTPDIVTEGSGESDTSQSVTLNTDGGTGSGAPPEGAQGGGGETDRFSPYTETSFVNGDGSQKTYLRNLTYLSDGYWSYRTIRSGLQYLRYGFSNPSSSYIPTYVLKPSHLTPQAVRTSRVVTTVAQNTRAGQAVAGRLSGQGLGKIAAPVGAALATWDVGQDYYYAYSLPSKSEINKKLANQGLSQEQIGLKVEEGKIKKEHAISEANKNLYWTVGITAAAVVGTALFCVATGGAGGIFALVAWKTALALGATWATIGTSACIGASIGNGINQVRKTGLFNGIGSKIWSACKKVLE